MAEKGFNWEKVGEAWGVPLVARTDVGKFSGGLLHPRTMANLDSLGEGPGKIVVGRRVAYRTEDLVAWLELKYGTELRPGNTEQKPRVKKAGATVGVAAKVRG